MKTQSNNSALENICFMIPNHPVRAIVNSLLAVGLIGWLRVLKLRISTLP